MRIGILGGDGFVGWPATLHLSARGHEVVIVDSLVRRAIDGELDVQSLTPDHQPQGAARHLGAADRPADRPRADRSRQGLRRPQDLAGAVSPRRGRAPGRAACRALFDEVAAHKRYTVDNNVRATHNLLCALVELGLDTHLVHLGTMGVYGYSSVGAPIPEGYLDVRLELPSGELADQEILYPANPGSVYHMTKCLDQTLLAFYAKNDGLRITDLHQGIVWGTNTPETLADPRLVNRFDYDGDYGTVLNRLLIQAAIGHPLTVHGTGGQTRAFIHIRDSVRCIELALLNPPARGDRVKIFNQMTETHRVRDLAELVAGLTGARIAHVANPRKEAAENDLVVENAQFLALGLEPTTLAQGLLDEIIDVARANEDRVDMRRIPCVSAWTAEIGARLADQRSPRLEVVNG